MHIQRGRIYRFIILRVLIIMSGVSSSANHVLSSSSSLLSDSSDGFVNSRCSLFVPHHQGGTEGLRSLVSAVLKSPGVPRAAHTAKGGCGVLWGRCCGVRVGALIRKGGGGGGGDCGAVRRREKSIGGGGGGAGDGGREGKEEAREGGKGVRVRWREGREERSTKRGTSPNSRTFSLTPAELLPLENLSPSDPPPSPGSLPDLKNLALTLHN
ncbi:hypothetical protein E2C01_027380 [Portunus trituberculatus]|uniref:Uncharacterized protein n=1 Tax=Portunus trituberculatus TaxID=210409 RepID=A0A5B7ELH2_PORTR|nr:hypothetical protein [Portunus trituberculatus]